MKAQKILQICIAFLCFLCFISCGNKSQEQSFTSKLDSVDNFISVGDYKSATNLLKKTAKQAKNPMDQIGVYRRYIQLGNIQDAEKCLKQGLKNFPQNNELLAVYTWFLHNQNRTIEAYQLAEKLTDTPYQSILAEFKLQQAVTQDVTDFLSKDYAPIYASAYISTKDEAWLTNAAIVTVLEGQYQEAYNFQPKDNVKNPYFWACISYDSKRYNSAIEHLQNQSSIDSQLLLADTYSILKEFSAAENIRQKLITQETTDQKLPPQIYYNVAKYAKDNNNWNQEYEYLNILTEKYPEYLPGVNLYADFAIRCLDIPQEDILAKELRQTNFRSASMKEYDKIARLSLDQAFAVLEKAKELDETSQAAALLFLFENDNKVVPQKLPEEKIAQLWLLIEEYSLGQACPEPLLKVAVPFLLQQDKIADAKKLFDIYLAQTYGSSSYPEVIEKMSPEECTYAAYFSATEENPNFPLALYIYELLLRDKTEINQNLAELATYQIDVSTIINMAELFAGSRQTKKAKEMYSMAIGIAKDSTSKADIMYRMANLQYITGDFTGAEVSLDYCLSIVPDHGKARILQNKIATSSIK